MLTGSYTLTHTESSSQNYSITIPMIEAKSDASKEQYCISLLHRNLECYVHESRQIESGQTGDGINILGISELTWTGMGEFNSGDLYIYYCGQESLRRNGAAIIVNKRV